MRLCISILKGACASSRLEGPTPLHPLPGGQQSPRTRQECSGLPPKSRERRWTWKVAWRTESHSRVELCAWANETGWAARATLPDAVQELLGKALDSVTEQPRLGAPWQLTGSSTIEGSEDGGGRWAASGCERDHPRLSTIHVSSSCTSGKKGAGAEHGCELRPTQRNQSSSHEGSGLVGLLTSNPILTAARASMAVSYGSVAAVTTRLEGGSPAETPYS